MSDGSGMVAQGPASWLRAGLWGAITAVVAIALLAFGGRDEAVANIGDYGGGSYSLTDHRGAAFGPETLIGQPSLLFFGFTHCPDVCPTTFAEIAGWLDALGAEGAAVRAFMITVDPARDTGAVLAEYLEWADGRITGVSGPEAEIAAMMAAWRVTAERVPGDAPGAYTMDHTASIFLVDADGRFRGTIAYLESWDTAIAKMRRLATGQW